MWENFYNRIFSLEGKIDKILSIVQQLQQGEIKSMASLDNILAQVSAQKTLEDSLKTFLVGLQAQLANAGTDPVKLQAVSDGLANNNAVLTSLIANTPAAPTAV
jgi:hypothetical protein